MPIYEYRCSECGHEFENIQRISEPDPTNCPACDAPKPGRLISRSAFHLRGGGWYAEGYGDAGSTSSSASAPAKEEKSTASSTPSAAAE